MPTGDQTKFNYHRAIFMPSFYGTTEHHSMSMSNGWATLWAPGDGNIGYVNTISLQSWNFGPAAGNCQMQLTNQTYGTRHVMFHRIINPGVSYFDIFTFPVPLTLLPEHYIPGVNEQISIYTSSITLGIRAFLTGWKVYAPS